MPNFDDPGPKYSGLKHHAKVHTFRIGTAILAWILIAAGLYYKPEWVQWGLRAVTRSMEAIGDAIPSPWGARLEVLLKEIGGFVWIQITALIILIRIVFSSIATGWRYTSRRDSGN
jgi:hypothetical protein